MRDMSRPSFRNQRCYAILRRLACSVCSTSPFVSVNCHVYVFPRVTPCVFKDHLKKSPSLAPHLSFALWRKFEELDHWMASFIEVVLANRMPKETPFFVARQAPESTRSVRRGPPCDQCRSFFEVRIEACDSWKHGVTLLPALLALLHRWRIQELAHRARRKASFYHRHAQRSSRCHRVL